MIKKKRCRILSILLYEKVKFIPNKIKTRPPIFLCVCDGCLNGQHPKKFKCKSSASCTADRATTITNLKLTFLLVTKRTSAAIEHATLE